MDLRQKGPGYVIDWAKKRISWELEKRRGHEEAAEEGAQFHNLAIQDAFLESVESYQVKPWHGPLALFRPPLVAKWEIGDRLVSPDRNYLYHDNDWTKWAPNIEVFEVPGDHDSMVLEPNVRVLAARIRRVLEQSEKQEGPVYDLSQEAAE